MHSNTFFLRGVRKIRQNVKAVRGKIYYIITYLLFFNILKTSSMRNWFPL